MHARADAGGCGSSGRGTAAAAAARAAGEKAGVVAAAARLLHELVDVPVFLPDQPLLLERRAEAGEERLVLRRGADGVEQRRDVVEPDALLREEHGEVRLVRGLRRRGRGS